MEESIEEVAIQQCYTLLGQFSVNQLVMFIIVLLLFGMVVWLAVYISKLQSKLRGMKEEFLKVVSRRKKK